MKFGRKIKASLYTEWRGNYLDYDALKKELKRRTDGKAWIEGDEQAFVHMLSDELEKVHKFQSEKSTELANRIKAAEAAVKSFVEDYEPDDDAPNSADRSNEDLEAGHGINDEGSDDDDDLPSVDALEEKFRELEEEVATLVADVHDLALFTKLNFTGFMKIVKKHDKQTGRTLKATFVQDYLDKRPFYKFNYDAIIVKLSKLYDLVRTRGHPIQGDSSAGGSQSAFVRQTTKYWVHPDNLVHLKLAILKNLPVLVFNPNKEFEPKDSAITSIYFDNEDLELYLGRLEKTEGAEAIRLRWYGDTSIKQIFVERKTHREDWTGEKSVKARFPIKEEYVNAFLAGEYTMDKEFDELVKKGKKAEQDVESMKQLANEVQYAIFSRKLVPVTRTFYNRTAFQLPGDARVRISLDTELTMIREDNWDGKIRSGSNWRRTDIGIDHPFPQVTSEDKELFQYGVLEVKLQTQMGQEPPDWVRELVSSHLVESIPKFSKFIHGCSTLLPHRVDLVPFWLPQMDTDIRKPDKGAMHIDRPTSHPSSTQTTNTTNTTPSPAEEHAMATYTEPLSEGEEDEAMDMAVAKDEGSYAKIPDSQAKQAIALREAMLKAKLEDDARSVKSKSPPMDGEVEVDEGANADNEEEEEDERVPFLRRRRSSAVSHQSGVDKPRKLSINPLAPASVFDQNFSNAFKNNKRRSVIEEGDEEGLEAEAQNGRQNVPEEIEYVRHFKAAPGKRVSVPVRIEPKVIFANERTFLKWLQFAVLIGTIATTLLNFTSADDFTGLVSAFLFTLASLLAIAYAGIIFVMRALSLRHRSADGIYYDKYGPSVLCAVLGTAVVANLGMRLKEIM